MKNKNLKHGRYNSNHKKIEVDFFFTIVTFPSLLMLLDSNSVLLACLRGDLDCKLCGMETNISSHHMLLRRFGSQKLGLLYLRESYTRTKEH